MPYKSGPKGKPRDYKLNNVGCKNTKLMKPFRQEMKPWTKRPRKRLSFIVIKKARQLGPARKLWLFEIMQNETRNLAENCVPFSALIIFDNIRCFLMFSKR